MFELVLKLFNVISQAESDIMQLNSGQPLTVPVNLTLHGIKYNVTITFDRAAGVAIAQPGVSDVTAGTNVPATPVLAFDPNTGERLTAPAITPSPAPRFDPVTGARIA